MKIALGGGTKGTAYANPPAADSKLTDAETLNFNLLALCMCLVRDCAKEFCSKRELGLYMHQNLPDAFLTEAQEDHLHRILHHAVCDWPATHRLGANAVKSITIEIARLMHQAACNGVVKSDQEIAKAATEVVVAIVAPPS